MNFLLAAMDLCVFGWQVFPIASGQKVPAIPKREGGRGVLDATDDLDKIEEWARRYPAANVGVACGDKSGLLVVDIDSNHGGMDSIKVLRAGGYCLPQTVSVRTPSGGWHLYYGWTAGPQNSKSKLGAGIDIRTGGGYVVAPPSCLIGGRAYSWYRKPLGADLPVLPRWALERLKPREETPFYAERREAGDIESLVIWMGRAPGGERNACLHWAAMRAGEAVRRGEIGEAEALADMIAAGRAVGLDEAECRKTAKSGLSRGMRR